MEKLEMEISIYPERPIKAPVEYIPLKKLELDPKNPRFKHLAEAPSQEKMMEIMWSDPATAELYSEIRFSQGLTERPYVKQINSDYTVVEGNRRVACLKEMVKKIDEGKENLPREKFDPVQCIILPPNISDADIALFLTRVHVSARKPWAALNKAAHVYDLYNIHHWTLEQIRDSVSIGKAMAQNMERAFKSTLEYHKKHPEDNEWLSRYSYFHELHKKKELREWAEKKDNSDHFMGWIAENQIKEGKDVRLLPDIIGNDEAVNALKNGADIKDAYSIAVEGDPALVSDTYKVIAKAIETLEDFPRSEIIATAKDKARIQYLERLHSETESLLKDIKSVEKSTKT